MMLSDLAEVMSRTLEHFCHPEHPLVLKEDDVIREDATCYVCNVSVIGCPTYTCASHDNIYCRDFYLHKSCAELPKEIQHHKHSRHPLVLLRRQHCSCNVCGRGASSVAYTCYGCDFDVCVCCAFEPRELRHEGHPEHTLTLMQRPALFNCDACGLKAEDYFFVCTTCDLCIHKKCAFAPFSIPAPFYHHHPLDLVYSIPDVHLYFSRYCAICDERIYVTKWLYYCHICTYFVHMECATTSDKSFMVNEIEADDIDNEPDLVQFPLPNEESIFKFIVTQCCKLQAHFQGELKSSITHSTIPDQPHLIQEHWSHKNHQLEKLELTISDKDNDHNDDNTRVFICDGCILPITVSDPSYYACMECSFILHSFCATKLPQELPAGACPFHPQHPLHLQKTNTFYSLVKCRACSFRTNGFFYQCETCDMTIDIRCAFLPARIKHISHKHHPLVQLSVSKAICSVTRSSVDDSLAYACETCSNFQINIICAFYPSSIKHKYDHHPITLRYPPFFYEGVFYCEMCEEQVNNQWLLYHCGESDHSFHVQCARWYENIKFGGTIQLSISNQLHTLALVMKREFEDSKPYRCGYCHISYDWNYFFECDGCGFLVCLDCV